MLTISAAADGHIHSVFETKNKSCTLAGDGP